MELGDGEQAGEYDMPSDEYLRNLYIGFIILGTLSKV